MLFIVLIVAGSLVSGLPSAADVADRTIIGKWCYSPGNPKYDLTMTILADDAGKFVLHEELSNGLLMEKRVSEYFFSKINGGLILVSRWEIQNGYVEFKEPDSLTGPVYTDVPGGIGSEKYRIVPNTGQLHILDDNGTVGYAIQFDEASPFACKAQRR